MSDFETISKRRIPSMDATLTLFRHPSGFEVYYIDAKDEESFFSYQFKTYPNSSNGVFHILEHTILSGSEKYRVRDPFSIISRSSCNTYLNALTFPDRTMYPAASPLKKDFDNIFLIYTDSVFRPLLRKETFLAEGIRVKKEGPYFDGVVFNEMRNDTLSHESVVSSHSLRDLFPNTMYSFSSGGEAKSIATLSYEEYLRTYDKFYHPSNGGLFLYGNMIDVEEKLNILSEYLKSYEKREKLPLYPGTVRWDEPKEATYYSSSSEGDDKITVIISYLTTLLNTSSIDRMFLSVLVDALLGSPSCPLYSALLSSNLADDISSQSGMSGDFFEIPFSVGLTGVKKEKVEEAKAFIISSIEKIANEGLDKDLIEAAIRRQEFAAREIPGGMPNGFRLLLRCSRTWARGEDIIPDLDSAGAIKSVRDAWIKDENIFNEFLKKELVNNPHRLTITVIADDDKVKEEEDTLVSLAKEKLNSVNDQDEKCFTNFISKPDDEKDIQAIPCLTLNDVPVRGNSIDMEDVDGILVQPQLTGGIIYFDIVVDISDKSNEELLYFSLLSRELPIAGLIGEDKSLINRKLRLLTGSLSYFIETGKCQDGSTRASFVIRMKVLRENLNAALNELSRLLKHCDIAQVESVKGALNDIKTDFAENVSYAGTSFAASSASASLSPSLSLGEDVMGIKAWQAFSNLTIDKACREVQKAYLALSERGRFIIHLTLEEADRAFALKEAKEFLSKMVQSDKISPLKREITENRKSIFYPLPVPVSYNALSIPSAKYSTLEEASQEIVSNIFSAGPLWQEVRTVLGAYGVEMVVDPLEGSIVVATYNDPNIMKTYETILRVVKDYEIKEEDIENAKLSIIGKLLKPLSPSVRAIVGFRRYLYGITPDLRAMFRENILASSKDDLIRVKEDLVVKMSSASKATLGSRELFEREDSDFVLVNLPQA